MKKRLPDKLRWLRDQIEEISAEAIIPEVQKVDRDGLWPEAGLRRLQQAGLMGLNAPKSVGGHGEGMLALVIACEALGRHCSSTALCYGMHCVATAVIAAKATAYQQEQYLAPIAAGKHISTLALSEAGTGSHFYLPETKLTRKGDKLIINGTKQFVTSAGRADSYVISTVASIPVEEGEFSCLIVDHGPGISWGEPWQGLGMRGNESRSMTMENLSVPAVNLLGNEGEEIWYMFEVLTPYFLMAMSGTYLGIAQAALELALAHVKARQYTHTGQALSSEGLVQAKVAEMWMEVEKARLFIYEAAQLGDEGDSSNALLSLLSAKADIAEVVVRTTNDAMTLCGGSAYRANGRLAQLMRDARASHIMAPTTSLLKTWAARIILGHPLF